MHLKKSSGLGGTPSQYVEMKLYKDKMPESSQKNKSGIWNFNQSCINSSGSKCNVGRNIKWNTSQKLK